MRLVGYADRLSVAPGGEIAFHLSSEHPAVRIRIVRLRRPGSARHGAELVEQDIPVDLPEQVPGRVQQTTSGSYVSAATTADTTAFGMAAWFRPTGPGTRPLLALGDVVLDVGPDGVTLRRGADETARLEAPLPQRTWAFVAATVDVDGGVRLSLHRPGAAEQTVTTATRPVRQTAPRLLIGSDGSAGSDGSGLGHTFNGVVARTVVSTVAWPAATTDRMAAGADPLALLPPPLTSALDLASDPSGTLAPDRGGLTAGGRVHQLPGRGVPGPFWTGAETDFRRSPFEFDGIHLHDDDLADAGWAPDLRWRVPAGLPSGVYALHACAGDDVDRIPFVVTPAAADAPVLVVLPTWTYLAYANWRTYAEYERERVAIYGERREIDERDRWLAAHPELGRSLYDVHGDGSGVFHSSRLRPIVNIRPDYFTPTTRGFRHFAQDLLLLAWLDDRGERYAVVTDDEVDRHGADLLAPYRVVLTGSHPEYCSAAMLDAYLAYTHHGGRLMYLGGNGFYQVTARHPGHPDAIEIRRGHAGVATWVSDPGEEHLASTGERGGLWRMRGRAPNVVGGVGFTAQGHDKADGYVRSPASADPRVAWVFDGVTAGPGELFGAEGPGLGGAAGDELDRADVALGTPPDAVVLASSTGHSERIVLVPEEVDHGYAAPPPGIHPNVRADIVLLDRPGGGAVFAVGSIAWSTAMSHAGGENDTARITANVLDRFRDHPGPVVDAGARPA